MTVQHIQCVVKFFLRDFTSQLVKCSANTDDNYKAKY